MVATAVEIARRLRRQDELRVRRRAASLQYVVRRPIYGAFHALVRELGDESEAQFRWAISRKVTAFPRIFRYSRSLTSKSEAHSPQNDSSVSTSTVISIAFEMNRVRYDPEVVAGSRQFSK